MDDKVSGILAVGHLIGAVSIILIGLISYIANEFVTMNPLWLKPIIVYALSFLIGFYSFRLEIYIAKRYLTKAK